MISPIFRGCCYYIRNLEIMEVPSDSIIAINCCRIFFITSFAKIKHNCLNINSQQLAKFLAANTSIRIESRPLVMFFAYISQIEVTLVLAVQQTWGPAIISGPSTLVPRIDSLGFCWRVGYSATQKLGRKKQLTSAYKHDRHFNLVQVNHKLCWNEGVPLQIIIQPAAEESGQRYSLALGY